MVVVVFLKNDCPLTIHVSRTLCALRGVTTVTLFFHSTDSILCGAAVVWTDILYPGFGLEVSFVSQ